MNSEVKEGLGWLYDVYTPTSQEYLLGRLPKVGTTRELQDGRKFVFVCTAVNAVAGQVMAAPASVAEITSGSVAAIVGDVSLTITRAGTTLNQFAGGFITLTDTAGVETTYGIVRNTAASAANLVTLYLDNPLVGAVAPGDDFILTPPKFGAVIINTASTLPVGVAIRPSTAATDGTTNYMWIQYAGVGGIKITTAAGLTAGKAVMGIAAGSVAAADGTLQQIGVMLPASAVSDGDVAPVHITLGY